MIKFIRNENLKRQTQSDHLFATKHFQIEIWLNEIERQDSSGNIVNLFVLFTLINNEKRINYLKITNSLYKISKIYSQSEQIQHFTGNLPFNRLLKLKCKSVICVRFIYLFILCMQLCIFYVTSLQFVFIDFVMFCLLIEIRMNLT